ncbi:hypothetical protein D3C86_2051430 [compost metagenome]
MLDVLEQEDVRAQGIQHHHVLLEEKVAGVAGFSIAVNMNAGLAQAANFAATYAAEALAGGAADQH